ncbi:MAG TPA: hypothetical protein PLQ67_07955, partial [Burkholderiaceae bacterium]|nr:hypothetical protein [Burkholderiaceae bacterium]
MQRSPRNTRFNRAVFSRLAAALLGGYALTWGAATLFMAISVALGMAFHDAEAIALIVAFVFFLAVFLWGFAQPSGVRVGLMLTVAVTPRRWKCPIIAGVAR